MKPKLWMNEEKWTSIRNLDRKKTDINFQGFIYVVAHKFGIYLQLNIWLLKSYFLIPVKSAKING